MGEQTLYDRIGRRDAVSTAVDVFYTKVLAVCRAMTARVCVRRMLIWI